jgi:hypothetical protein
MPMGGDIERGSFVELGGRPWVVEGVRIEGSDLQTRGLSCGSPKWHLYLQKCSPSPLRWETIRCFSLLRAWRDLAAECSRHFSLHRSARRADNWDPSTRLDGSG